MTVPSIVVPQLQLYTTKRGRAPQRVQQLRDQLKAAGFSLTPAADMTVRKVEKALQQWEVAEEELGPLITGLKVFGIQ